MSDEQTTNDDLNDHAVERAMRSDAERIAEECDALKAMLLEKNKAYGSSALAPVRIFSKADTVEQIRVRLDDKLSRLMRGSAAGEDVVKDLLGYLILLRIATKEQWDKQVHVAASPEVIEEVLAAEHDCDDPDCQRCHHIAPLKAAAAREDVGFALTDAEAAEAEQAADAYVAKKRPAGREHLPTSYELDRAESIAQRLREENRALVEKLTQERETGEELRAEAKRAWSHVEEIATALGCGTSKVQILMTLTKTMAKATRETEEARNGRDEAIRQRDALYIERDALAADNGAMLREIEALRTRVRTST